MTDEQDFTSVTYPAVAFCKSLRETYGGNWHLPSIEEMRIMINSYYGHNYIRPFAHAYDDGITRYPIDYRYPMHNQSSAQYQEILACKKNFDDLLTALPRTDESLNGTYDSLDGVSVDNTQAEYAIDSNSKTDDFGDNNGVIYWLSRESSDGSKAYIARFGVFYYDLSEKTSTSNKYVRCIKDVSLD